jgi:hypothetical protein
MKTVFLIVILVFTHCNLIAQWVKTTFPKNSYLAGAYHYIQGDTIFISMESYGSGFYRSIDDGNTWEDIYDSLPHEKIVNSIIYSRGYLVACLADGNPDSTGGIYRSLDNGNHWHIVNGNGAINGGITLFSNYQSFLLGAYNSGGLLLSTDTGENWKSIDKGIQGGGINGITENNEVIYISSYGGGIYRSSDSGQTWVTFNNQIKFPLHGVIDMGKILFCPSGSLFQSSDSAIHWTASTVNVTPVSMDKSSYFLFVGGDKVFYTSDTGKTWKDITGNIPTSVSFIASNDTYIFAGSNDEIWRRPLSDFTNAVHQNPESNLKLFIISNPITSSADFQFDALQEPTLFELFDALGRSVFHQQLPAAQASLRIDMQKYPAGIYIARLGGETVRVIKY